MKRLAMGAAVLGGIVAMMCGKYPDEVLHGIEYLQEAWIWVRSEVMANPFPVGLVLGTFVLTVIYHTARGRSLRESVEMAATRVKVVTVPASDWLEDDDTVVGRARVRTLRAQLLTDQNGLENLSRKLPEEILKAEKEACYSEQALADAEKKLADRRQAHIQAVNRLEALKQRRIESEAELAEIREELARIEQRIS